jgi:hypothetical protein
VLVVVGAIFFMDTKLNMDMEWLEEWWPVALVVAGVWLIYKARASND